MIEINEAFASQGLASLRLLGISDHDPRVNPYGGAIALGHPLGMSGARITGTSALQLDKTGDKALATMCIGVGHDQLLYTWWLKPCHLSYPAAELMYQ